MGPSYVFLHSLGEQARVRIRLAGPDARRFLQGTLSCDLGTEAPPAEAPRTAQAGGLLTVKGKLVSDVIAVPGGDAAQETYDLFVPRSIGTEVAALLERHIVMDDVTVDGPHEDAVAVAWNPVADLLAPVGDGVHAVATRYPAPAWLVWSSEPAALERALAELTPVSGIAWDRYRVQSASPAWGQELAVGFFPPEVGFAFGVSYDKGCYLGQEPLARIHARGQVNRVMVRVAGQRRCSIPVALHHPERPEAGTLTTWVPDENGGFIGLAIVRRTLATPGTVLTATGEGGETLELLVASEALGDDPGIGSSQRRPTVRLS